MTEEDLEIEEEQEESSEVYMIHSNNFSAAVDAFVINKKDDLIYFVSMAGPQTSLRAIAASMLKQPPENAWVFQGKDNIQNWQLCRIPLSTIGTWTIKTTKMPSGYGHHSFVYTKLAEFTNDKDSFLLLVKEGEAPEDMYYRFLDRRTKTPILPEWKDWLWNRGLKGDKIHVLDSYGLTGYLCEVDENTLRVDLSREVKNGNLQVGVRG